jgi:hypothetical protein
MSDVLTAAAQQAVNAKLALGELLILTERHAEIGTRLCVRRLVHLFEFRLGFFLNRFDPADYVPLGLFFFWFVALPRGVGEIREVPLIEDTLVASQCLSQLTKAESRLASAVEVLLNSSIPRVPDLTNPVSAIGGAKYVLDQIKGPLLMHSPEQIPLDQPHDAHLWTYVLNLTPASFQKDPWRDGGTRQ